MNDPYERKRKVLQEALKRSRERGFDLGSGHMVARDNETGNILGWESWAFSHEFAKAFWGVTPQVCSVCERPHTSNNDCDAGTWPESAIDYYQFKERELVASVDRIEFLAKELGL